MATPARTPTQLTPGQSYTWTELAVAFGFAPDYLGVAGGMMPRSSLNALVLVTWPGGARSFNYDDYWRSGDLIYTGRGKRGDQKLEGANRYLADNRFTNYVFEGGVGSQRLRFLGTATSVQYWRARGLGDDGNNRRILRYRLRFATGGASASSASTAGAPAPAPPRRRRGAVASRQRERREFDPGRSPAQYRTPVQHATPEETAARREKANQNHYALLCRLQAQLAGAGWSDIVEIPSAIDLEARKQKRRVVFEAKTITDTSELSQTRSALSQLLEYRFFYGEPNDGLCVVTDGPVGDRRMRFLDSQGVAVAYDEGNGLVPCGALARKLLG